MRTTLDPTATALTATLFLTLAPTLAAQHPRPSQMVDPTPASDSGTPAVKSRGELSALAFIDGASYGGGMVMVSTADGRGLDWSPATRIDSDTTLSPKHVLRDNVEVWEDRIYVCWDDTRLGNTEVYLNTSFDGGASWTGEIRIPKGFAAGNGSVHEYSMSVSPDPGGGDDHVYFLFSTFRPGTIDGSVYFTASHDAGATWSLPYHLPAGFGVGLNRADNVQIKARGGMNLYALWQDDRGGYGGASYDVFFQRSTNGGATWHPVDIQLNSVGGTANGQIVLASEAGGNVMAVWTDESSAGGGYNDEVRCNYSNTAGLAWSGPLIVGLYVPGVDDVGVIDCLYNNGIMAVAYTDDRTGSDEAYVSVSTTGGATWVEWPLSLAGGANSVQLNGHDDFLAVTWDDFALNTGIHGSFSRDGGVNWDPAFPMSTATGDCEWHVVDYNNRYANFLLGWMSDDTGSSDNVYIGGYRPQTLNPTGTFQIGTNVNWGIEHYPASQAGWSFGVLASAGTGSYVLGFGDGRETGLVSDGYLAWSLANIPGVMSGTVDAFGGGATPMLTVPATVPPFLTLSFAAVSFTAGGGSTSLGALTDLESATILP